VKSVEEQRARVLDAAVMPRPVRVAISEAQGLLCAEEVVTQSPLPGFDQAAIDGYAVRSIDIQPSKDDVPITLPVVGEVSAGSRQPTRLQPRQAVRVDTGAPLPTLADAVLPLSWTDGNAARLTVTRAVRSGDFVRHVGDDVQPGDVAVRSGTVIGAAQVGLLAAVGTNKVLVNPRPRLSVISVGGELVDIDRSPGSGQVYDVNSYALAAAARDAGATVTRVGIAGGDPRRLRDVVEGQLIRSEIVVISGAVGGGASEQVREVLADLGEVTVDRVAMHPGSVQGFGRLGDERMPTFLLPANPVSALVVFEVMVRPLVRVALGKRNPMRRVVTARTVAPVTSIKGRAGFLRGQLMRDEGTGDYLVQALGGAPGSSSHLLATLAEANCLVLVEPDVTEVRTGDEVQVAFLAQRA